MEKKAQHPKRKYEEAIKKMRESGLMVTNLADKGIKSIGFIGGVSGLALQLTLRGSEPCPFKVATTRTLLFLLPEPRTRLGRAQ